MLRRVWVNLLKVFSEDYTREGFKMTGSPFALPKDVNALDPLLKRKVTICNLFANEHKPIDHISHLLDLEKSQVVSTLIQTRLIDERRRTAKPVRRERRSDFDHYHISLALLTGRKVHELRTLCGCRSDNFVSSRFVLQDLVKEAELCARCKEEYLRREGAARA